MANRLMWLVPLAAAWLLGCEQEQEQPAATPQGSAGMPSSPSHGGSQQATAGAPQAVGGASTQDWSRLPFKGSAPSEGGAASAGASGMAGAAGGTGGELTASCDVLCDCIVDVCGNVLRIFEHGQCLPGCQGLNEAQRACRLTECLQGGSDTLAAARCDHAIGRGAELPAACVKE